MPEVHIPNIDEMMNPTLQAIQNLGGSAMNEEIYDEVVSILDLSDEQLAIQHKPASGTQTEVAFRVSYARTYLRRYGILENPSRKVWTLTERGIETKNVDPNEVKRVANAVAKKEKESNMNETYSEIESTEVGVNDLVASLLGWREALSGLLEQLTAESFERLFLRLLGEDGIHDIELTGPNDAIEGIGTVGGGGFFSFRVSFKCIRGGGRVSSGEIEDFRRAVMVGRADRGLLITTGKFTQEAMLKAASDRAPEIKLIDVDEFVDKLKELKLGVRSEKVVVERVVIDEEWFRGI